MDIKSTSVSEKPLSTGINTEKIEVVSAEIIARRIDGRPYFEIKYQKMGSSDYNIGYGSYNMYNVFHWLDTHFTILDPKDIAYCECCNAFVKFYVKEDTYYTQLFNVPFKYCFDFAHCSICGCEVEPDDAYKKRKHETRDEEYRRTVGIITNAQIREIMRKYKVDSESLSIIAGIASDDIDKSFNGYIMSKESSDKLLQFLNDETLFYSCVESLKLKFSDLYHKLCSLNQNDVKSK